jgi:glycosyltransferase involved in cell wall biosynthesis
VLFSVIIPTYNRLRLLLQTLGSVWAQTFTDYEVLIVDDGSTDGTQKYLDSLRRSVKYFFQANRGPGAARNLAVRQAKGDYVAFLDSDDVWFRWTLACFAELIREHDRPAILVGKVLNFHNEGELRGVREVPLQADAFPDYFASHRSACCFGAGMSVLRREAFLQAGGYTEKRLNGQDHDLILRMGQVSTFIQITSPTTLGRRRHCASATMDLRRSWAGSLYLIKQEHRGAYPGGAARRSERRRIVSRHVRSTALACLREGRLGAAWALYRATLGWHLQLGKVKFIVAFPLLAMTSRFRFSRTKNET